MFSSAGSFITSTPIHKECDSGFYENTPSTSFSLSSAGESLECNYSPLRKNLFGKRSNSEDVPDSQLHRHKFHRRTYSHRGESFNKETPRASKRSAISYKPRRISENEIPHQELPLFLRGKQISYCSRPKSPKSESLETKHSLSFPGANNCDDLSASDLAKLYFIHRFQLRRRKPTEEDIACYEKHMLNVNGEMLRLWKNDLECISATVDQPKIDFLDQLYTINAPLIVTNILSYLSGSDLQNASSVSQLWRKLVLEDKDASRARWAYFQEKQKEKMEKIKLLNKVKRPPDFRTLESLENIHRVHIQSRKTIKEINFDEWIKVGKNVKPMKCPSCTLLSLPKKHGITKYNCVFCGYEFCCNCLKPYTDWHFCASTGLQAAKPQFYGRKYLRRL